MKNDVRYVLASCQQPLFFSLSKSSWYPFEMFQTGICYSLKHFAWDPSSDVKRRLLLRSCLRRHRKNSFTFLKETSSNIGTYHFYSIPNWCDSPFKANSERLYFLSICIFFSYAGTIYNFSILRVQVCVNRCNLSASNYRAVFNVGYVSFK